MSDIYNAFIDFIWSVVLSIFVLLTDLFYFLLESIMAAAITLLDGLSDVFDVFDLTSYISAIPDEVMNVAALSGISTCTSMIVSALLIRMILQLIPFTRLGS